MLLNRKQQFLVSQWFEKHRNGIDIEGFDARYTRYYDTASYRAVLCVDQNSNTTKGINEYVKILYDSWKAPDIEGRAG